MLSFFKKYHKWLGIVLAFFLLASAFSGIVMNHRKQLAGLDISRSWLPASYSYQNWNNASVKGSFVLAPDSVLLYGGAGIWQTDTLHRYFNNYNQGLKKGVDNRFIAKIVQTANGKVFAASTFDLYELQPGNVWKCISDKTGIQERISDLALKGDSLLVLTRSEVFVSQAPYQEFNSLQLKEPVGYSKKAYLFRVLWLLHSGELFGLPGQLFVDFLGVLLIIVSLTGIVYFFSPKVIKWKKRRNKTVQKEVKTLRFSIKWHNTIGVYFLLFFFISALSALFLRPPMMIAIIKTQVNPPPGSILDTDNPWHDKLRCLAYDSRMEEWLLYSSAGFYALKDLDSRPTPIENTPPVSVMGVNLLVPTTKGWLVGSFSGLYDWDRQTGVVTDCYKRAIVTEAPHKGRPVFEHQVQGYSNDFYGKTLVFEYDKGAINVEGESFAPMPTKIQEGHISLWHACLELHVGRVYQVFMGPFSDLYVFLFSLFTLLIYISGLVVYVKRYRRKK